MDEWVWSISGMILTVETEVLWYTSPNTTLFSKSRTWADPASNSDLRERSTTHRLSYSSAGGIYWPTKRLSAYVRLYVPTVCFKQMRGVTAPVAIFCTKWLLSNIGPSARSCLFLVSFCTSGVGWKGLCASGPIYLSLSLLVPLALSGALSHDCNKSIPRQLARLAARLHHTAMNADPQLRQLPFITAL